MAKAYVTNGDVGCSVPGSLQWHKCAVAEMNLDERVGYFREVLSGMTIDDTFAFMSFLIAEAVEDGDSS